MIKFLKGLLLFLAPVFVIIGIPVIIVDKGLLFSSWSISFNPISSWVVPARSIFLAILIESFPFILVGALLSSLIHELVPEQRLIDWIPKNKVLSVLFGGLIGFVLPVCDCGTIPIARSLLQKGIPRSVVIAFTLAAPVVNPVTLFATYFAFGMNIRITIVRVLAAYCIACMAGFIVGGNKQTFIGKKFQSRMETAAAADNPIPTSSHKPSQNRVRSITDHIVSELFGIIGFLICSAAVASIYQVYHTQHSAFGQMHTGVLSIIALMALAIVFSLCSQADAFVARSFSSSYSPGAVLAFMLIGQMTDIRNLFLLPKTFGGRTAIKLIGLCLLLCLAAGVIYH